MHVSIISEENLGDFKGESRSFLWSKNTSGLKTDLCGKLFVKSSLPEHLSPVIG